MYFFGEGNENDDDGAEYHEDPTFVSLHPDVTNETIRACTGLMERGMNFTVVVRSSLPVNRKGRHADIRFWVVCNDDTSDDAIARASANEVVLHCCHNSAGRIRCVSEDLSVHDIANSTRSYEYKVNFCATLRAIVVPSPLTTFVQDAIVGVYERDSNTIYVACRVFFGTCSTNKGSLDRNVYGITASNALFCLIEEVAQRFGQRVVSALRVVCNGIPGDTLAGVSIAPRGSAECASPRALAVILADRR